MSSTDDIVALIRAGTVDTAINRLDVIEKSLNGTTLACLYHAAADEGCWEFMSVLLSRGLVEIDVRNAYDSTALHVSCRKQHVHVVQSLLDAGANASAVAAYGTQPLHSACHHDRSDIPLALLASGADANALDDENNTPLHAAASVGSATVVALLLAGGASFTIANARGRTPVHIATVYAHVPVVQLLLTAGADVAAVDGYGYTLLHLAAATGRASVTELILANGGDVRAVATHLQRLPLHCAVLGGDIASVAAILAAGAAPAVGDLFDHTPLYLARKMHRYAIARLLISSYPSDPAPMPTMPTAAPAPPLGGTDSAAADDSSVGAPSDDGVVSALI